MKTIIYQGWRYDFDENRPAKGRFVATKDGKILKASSDRAIRETIDAFVEIEAESRARSLA